MRILTVAMGKGGVGKTSLCVNLAAGLAEEGKRVLLVDADATAHATSWLLGMDLVGKPGLAEALREERLRPELVVEVPAHAGLYLLPASRSLQVMENELREDGGHAILRNILRATEVFDYIIIDTPPSIGAFTVAALYASDAVLAPLPCGFLSLAGLRLLEESMEKLKRRVAMKAELVGVVLFGSDPREAITSQMREALERDVGKLLFKSEVRVSTASKVLPAIRKTVFDPGADPRGLEDYQALLRELTTRLDGRHLRKVKG